jgi:hypothetical protein
MTLLSIFSVNAVPAVSETSASTSATRQLDVVAVDGRTPLIIADGVEYGNSFASQPHTAVLPD